jgi:hypothetical protein
LEERSPLLTTSCSETSSPELPLVKLPNQSELENWVVLAKAAVGLEQQELEFEQRWES